MSGDTQGKVISGSNWHLDKKVPLALLFAIVVQTASAFWWAGKVDAALGYTELRIQAVEAENKLVRTLSEKVIRIESHMDNVDKNIERLMHSIERHTDKVLGKEMQLESSFVEFSSFEACDNQL